MNTASVTRAFARNAAESAYPNLWKGLVAAWLPPGAPRHPTRLIDYSGNGNHGTLQNGASWDIGKAGRCVSFDGVDDCCIGDTAGKNFPISNQSRSISCWIYGTTYSLDRGIIHWGTDGHSATGTNFHLVAGSSGTILWGNGFNDGLVSGITNWSDSKWHHIVATYDSVSNTGSIFIDSRLDASNTLTYAPNTGTANNWQIGKFLGGNGLLQAKLCSVLMFKRILNLGEITLLGKMGNPVNDNTPIISISRKTRNFSFCGAMY